MLTVFQSVLHQHDLRLVALAACICAMACFTTLTMLGNTPSDVGEKRPPIALVTAGLVFGAGVWALHFVAMMAYMPGMPMHYGGGMTAGSLGVAVLGAILAFWVWRHIAAALPASLAGGALLGLTISAMHYAGMAAMQPGGTKNLDPLPVAASVAVGIAFAALALWRGTRLADMRCRAETCLWLSISICGVHFTGMSALHVHLAPGMAGHGALTNSVSLAVVIGTVAMAVLLNGLGGAILDQRMTDRTAMDLQRMRRLSNLSHEALILHRNGLVLEVNEAGGRLFGAPCDDLPGRRVLDLFAPADAAAASRLIAGGAGDTGNEVMVQAGADRQIPVEISSSDIDLDGKPAIATALRDLTERRSREERIRHLAHHDALTDLPNRSLLTERLTRTLGAAEADGSGVAVLYIDLDRFKPVNDLLGHAGGDQLLVQVAGRLRAELRPTDTLARVGGDEFVVVTPIGLAPSKAAAIAHRLIAALSRPFDLSGRTVDIGASIGVALYPTDATEQEDLIRAADTALYRVKAETRGAFCLYEPKMDDQLRQRRSLEQDLRHAVERNELRLHYQPVVNCRTGRLDGFEALLRWQHSERGMIPPGDFIPIAEETLVIGGIGEWVLHAACTAAMQWPAPYWVAVNASALQFRQPDFAERIADVLARTGLPASRLEIEVTESVFVNDAAQAKAVMVAIRKLGVRVSLDDFGTGYSSLSYLCSFAFDKIKIDRSFIMALGDSDQALTVVRTILNLGHNLGLAVTAEGIETAEQLHAVVGLSCDHVQGYLLGRPQPHLPSWTTVAALAPQPRRALAEV